MIGEIVTPWIAGDGSWQNPNRPKVADDYTLESWGDVAGITDDKIVPMHGLTVIQAKAPEAIFDAIDADADYVVLWCVL